MQQMRQKTRLSVMLRWVYNISFIGKSKWITIVNVLMVGLACSYFTLLKYWGESIRRAKEDEFRRSCPEVILSKIRDDLLLDANRRFTQAKLNEIRSDPRVADAFEHISRIVYMSADGKQEVSQEVQGTRPGDKRISQDFLAWGSPVGTDDSNEIIVSEGVLEKMGYFQNETTPGPMNAPEKIKIFFVRYLPSGATQPFTREYILIGIKKGFYAEAFLPIRQMWYMELWSDNKIAQVPMPGQQVSFSPELRIPYAKAFSLADQNVAPILANLKLTEEKQGQPFTDIFSQEDPCLLIEGKDGILSDVQFAAALRSAKNASPMNVPGVVRFRMAELEIGFGVTRRPVKMMVINLNQQNTGDLIQTESGTSLDNHAMLGRVGNVLVSEPFSRYLPSGGKPGETISCTSGVPRQVVVADKVRSAVGNTFDMVCSTETYNYLKAEIKSDKQTIVFCSDPLAASRIGAIIKNPRNYKRRIVSRDYDEGARYSSEYFLGDVAVLRVEPEKLEVAALMLPDEAMRKFSSCRNANNLADYPVILVTDREAGGRSALRSRGFGDWIHRYGLTVSAVFEGMKDEVWVPSSLKTILGLASYGRLVLELNNDFNAPITVPHSEYFTNENFGLVEGAKEAVSTAVLKQLGFMPFCLVCIETDSIPNIRFSSLGRDFTGTLLSCSDSSIEKLPFFWAASYRSLESDQVLVERKEFVYPKENETLIINGARALMRFSADLLPAEKSVLCSKSFVASNSEKLCSEAAEVRLPPERAAFLFSNLLQYRSVLSALRAIDALRISGTKVDERQVVCYLVRDGNSVDRRIGEQSMKRLWNEYTFTSVIPGIELKAELCKSQDRSNWKPMSLSSSESADPTQFMVTLKAGQWLRKSDEYSVILPEAAFDDEEKKGIDEIIGKGVLIRFKRENSLNPLEVGIDITFTIRGIVAGAAGYIPVKAASDIEMWRQNIMEYYPDVKVFRPPVQRLEDIGWARAVVFTKTFDDVPGVAQWLFEMGYVPTDLRAQYENNKKSFQNIRWLTWLMALGSIVAGGAIVFITTWMNAQSKRVMYGNLRADGGGKGTIYRIFLLLGLMVGISAFFTSTIVANLTEPLLLRDMLESIDLSLAKVTVVPMWNIAVFWEIYIQAFMLTTVLSIVSVLFTAWSINRCTVRDLLAQRFF